jgi:DCN1-like protein 4/5
MPRPKRRSASSNTVVEVQEQNQSKRPRLTSSKPKFVSEETKFSNSKCLGWFRKYTTDDPMQLGPEGMERFCEDIKLEPEDIAMLCIAFKMNAKNMGYFTQSEWIRGLSDPEVLCDSPAKLQNKTNYFYSLLSDQQTFKLIFRYVKTLKLTFKLAFPLILTFNFLGI